MPKALVIEDDPNIVQLIRLELADLGFETEEANDGTRGVERATSEEYDLVILDLMLPELGGVEVLKQIREVKRKLPVIVLTAQKDEINKVLLLELGADDYITKPFGAMELKARIKAVRRRWTEGDEPQTGFVPEGIETKGKIKLPQLEVDLDLHTVVARGENIEVTPTEFAILVLLASRPNRPFSRSEITTHAFGYESDGYEKSVTSHINRLRKKLEHDADNPQLLLTARGIGYYLKAD